MYEFSRNTLFFLLFFIIVIVQFQYAVEEGGQNVAQNQPEKPFISKMVMDTISLLKRSHKSSWEKIKTVIHDVHMQFSPPNLDFRVASEADSEKGFDSVKGTMKDAAEKSFDKSKETVEETAKSAAKMVGEAIHKTQKEVKESASDSQKESDAEL